MGMNMAIIHIVTLTLVYLRAERHVPNASHTITVYNVLKDIMAVHARRNALSDVRTILVHLMTDSVSVSNISVERIVWSV